MTSPIKSSPKRLVFDQAEIFAEKAHIVIKIKQIMLERKLTEEMAACQVNLELREFKNIIAGTYIEYPLAYLRTLHKRILTGEA